MKRSARPRAKELESLSRVVSSFYVHVYKLAAKAVYCCLINYFIVNFKLECEVTDYLYNEHTTPRCKCKQIYWTTHVFIGECCVTPEVLLAG